MGDKNYSELVKRLDRWALRLIVFTGLALIGYWVAMYFFPLETTCR